MVELVRAGRDPTDLAREFEPSAIATRSVCEAAIGSADRGAIRNWVMQADLAEGRREKPTIAAVATEGALTTAERDELARLRRENKQLRVECDILSRAAAWFARETGAVPSSGSSSS